MLKTKGIKRRVAHAVLYGKSLTHIKHYRGFGVHSPFVYSLIRNVFMCKHITGPDTELYDALRTRGISERRARQLQNMMSFCAYKNFVIADRPSDTVSLSAQTLCLVSREYPQEGTLKLAAQAESTGGTLCLLEPTFSRTRNRMCRKMVKSHRHTSVDNRGFLLLFYHDKLPKQHFKL